MIPLVVRSHASLMWGTSAPEHVALAAKTRGYGAVALTDTDNLYGLWPFLEGCRENGVRAIVGAEVTEGERGAEEKAASRSPLPLAPRRPSGGQRVVCLVENAEGYRNLCRLLTRRHTKVDFALGRDLPELAVGLCVLTSSPELLTTLFEAGVNVFAALPRRPSAHAARVRAEANRMGVAAVAVPSSFFLVSEDHELHRLLRAIAGNTSFSRLKAAEVAPADAWLAPPEEYLRRFEIWPETLTTSDALAERLTFTGPAQKLIMPEIPGAAEILRERCYAGAHRRYGVELHETVVDRIEHELRTIEHMGFSSYFLKVEEIVMRSPRICGRGSGAASIVAYCLGITNVCPVKFNLYFERFLNPGRKDPPDIDVDFAWDERDAAIASVLQQYRGHSAMVASFAAFQPRMAIRETAKVFGLTDAEIGQVSKRLPWFWREVVDDEQDLLERLRALPELKELDFPEPWPEILQLAQRLIGIPRNISVHPGGVVLTPEPIDSYVPIEIAPKGVPIIQWEKDSTETAGLVKIDLLGNRSLAVIRDTLANVHANGVAFEENGWQPEDDPATQANVAAGKTLGCFYIESPAMRLLQQKSRRGDYEHVVIHSSIIRPAANKWIHEYLRRLHGGSWQPIHPLLAGVLDDNYGIMVYQEDVAKAAMALAGFDHVEADGLRKVMARKDRQKRLPDYLRRFIAGARQRGVSPEAIETAWDMILSFDGYSFCKPHSASYARVSFQAVYLKTHFPAEFMAAVITNQGGFYSTAAYVSEARRMGVRVLPPDVNKSEIAWRGRGRELRVGWGTLRHLGKETRERIVALRPFRDLTDFLERVRPDDNEARVLLHARAFDGFHPQQTHSQRLWQILSWRANDHASRDLFNRRDQVAPSLQPDRPQDVLREEMQALEFLCDRHPMTLYALDDRVVKAKNVARFAGRRVRCAGFLITGKVVFTRQGEPMEFITFEDETGLLECTFFPETYRRTCHLLDPARPSVIEGQVEEDYGACTITVDRVNSLPLPLSQAA